MAQAAAIDPAVDRCCRFPAWSGDTVPATALRIRRRRSARIEVRINDLRIEIVGGNRQVRLEVHAGIAVELVDVGRAPAHPREFSLLDAFAILLRTDHVGREDNEHFIRVFRCVAS